MLTSILIPISILVFSQPLADSDESQVHATLTRFFSAVGEFDEVGMRAHATKDFQILDVGNVWDLDGLIEALDEMKSPDFERKTEIDVIRTTLADNVAWVTYWNRAEITSKKITGTFKWIESAVFRKQNGAWKIALIHSTQVK